METATTKRSKDLIPTNILFISGKAGSGKSTIAKFLKEAGFDVAILSFAKLLKRCALPLIQTFIDKSITLSDLDNSSVKLKELPGIGSKPITVRNVLQLLGTEFGKDLIEPTLWVKAIHKQMFGTTDLKQTNLKLITKESYIVIPDARFKDELEYGTSIGAYILHLERQKPKSGKTDMHRSETCIGTYNKYNQIYHNIKPLEDLKQDMIKLVQIKLGWKLGLPNL